MLARPRFLRGGDELAYLLRAPCATCTSARLRRLGRRVAEVSLDDVREAAPPAPTSACRNTALDVSGSRSA